MAQVQCSREIKRQSNRNESCLVQFRLDKLVHRQFLPHDLQNTAALLRDRHSRVRIDHCRCVLNTARWQVLCQCHHPHISSPSRTIPCWTKIDTDTARLCNRARKTWARRCHRRHTCCHARPRRSFRTSKTLSDGFRLQSIYTRGRLEAL